MKVAIMTLGFHPRPVEHIMLTKRPDECHVIASVEGLRYTASEHGYKKPNSAVLKKAAHRARCKLFFHRCDPFDPESVGDALSKVLDRIKIDDEVIINYSGGTQAMSLVLGSVAIVLSRMMPLQVLYSIRTPDGEEKILDHTEVIRELFRKLYDVVPRLEN
ncbi:MAG: hypothetical protein DRN83_02035 [Hadesarchaea archaeon]|nr:MAG: hypothetical protein DRN83_02035 [Hadesarchaea archaeon]HDI12779.1 hypothetical protein [Hadesarchaea archaeon]